VLVGDEAEKWDAIALLQYLGPVTFLDMARAAYYQKIHRHREAGLTSTVLIPCRQTAL